MNWYPRESAWDSVRARQEKQRANHEAFLEQQSAAADAFQAMRDDETMSMAELAGQAAAARVNKKA